MTNYFENIQQLFWSELYSNVEILASFVLSIYKSNQSVLTEEEHYYTYQFYGYSLFYLGKYSRALDTFNLVLQLRNDIKNSIKSYKNIDELFPTLEIKYKLHECLVFLKKENEAIEVLSKIPSDCRNSKINMALGKLYKIKRKSEQAITAFKNVLMQCPFALEAVEELLNLGVNGNDVNSLVIQSSDISINLNWLNLWIKGNAHKYNRDYNDAIQTFVNLNNSIPMNDNVMVLLKTAECYYLTGKTTNALYLYPKIYIKNSWMDKGLDIYVNLLFSEKCNKEIEKLIDTLPPIREYTVYHWIIWGYYFYSQKQLIKALYFGHKALMIFSQSVEALILKARVLYDLKKYSESLTHYRDVISLDGYRYEAYKGIIDCYLAMGRIKEAIALGRDACIGLKESPAALTLYAYVLMNDNHSTSIQAKSLLLRALAQDEHYFQAITQLTDIYIKEDFFEEAIELLEKKMIIRPSVDHLLNLANLYEKIHQEDIAIKHYQSVLDIDPKNTKALENISRLDSSSNMFNDLTMLALMCSNIEDRSNFFIGIDQEITNCLEEIYPNLEESS